MRYADAGVSIALAEQAKQRIRRLAGRTFTRNVLGGIGGVGGPFLFCREPRRGTGLGSCADSRGTERKKSLSPGGPSHGGGGSGKPPRHHTFYFRPEAPLVPP